MKTNALAALGSSLLALPSTLADDVLRAAEHAQHARADNTHCSHARAWEQWSTYALEHGACALPASPLVVGAYLAHMDAEGLGTRHSSDGMLRRYIRAGTMFDRDPLRGVLVR